MPARPARHRPRRRGVRAPRRSDPRRSAARPASACATRSSPSDSVSRAPRCARRCSASSAPASSRSRRIATRASRSPTRRSTTTPTSSSSYLMGNSSGSPPSAAPTKSSTHALRVMRRDRRGIPRRRPPGHHGLRAPVLRDHHRRDATIVAFIRSCARPRSRSAATSPGWHPFIECPIAAPRRYVAFRDAVAARDGARAESAAARPCTASPDRSAACRAARYA